MLFNDKRFAGALAVFVLAMVVTLAQAPSWWTNRNVIETNVAPRDFAPINQGQVKWMATQAAAEFDEKLALIGGAGSNITALVAGFSPTNNYRPVNLGQLKYVSAPFYGRLWELGLTNCYPPGSGFPYPWSNSTNAPRDFAIANIGQTKYVFSFDTAADSDGDGIPDMWEKNLGSNPALNDANAVNTNVWAQGQTNAEIYQRMVLLTIPNAWAVYTNTTQVAVVADIRSYNRYLTVQAAEFFLDTTNGVTYGAGTPMNALDGAFNSTNELAQAIYTPSFPAGERHVFYIHAKSSNNRWCPFVTAIINPNVDDILNKVQANYSAVRDLSYDAQDAVLTDGVIQSSSFRHVQQKGAYKFKLVNATDGSMEIINFNYDVKFSADQGILAYNIASTVEGFENAVSTGPSTMARSDQLDDFCWDVSTFRQGNAISLNAAMQQGSNAWYYLTATANDNSETIQIVIDFKRGTACQKITSFRIGPPLVTQLGNVQEIMPGIWLPLTQIDTMTLQDGTVLGWNRNLSAVRINTGIQDALFNVPPPP